MRQKGQQLFLHANIKTHLLRKNNDLLIEEKIKTQLNTEKNTRGSNARKIYGFCLAYAYITWQRHTKRKRQKNLGSRPTLVLVWHFQALLLPSDSVPPRQWGSGRSFLSFIFHHKDKDSRWGIDDFIKYRRKA